MISHGQGFAGTKRSADNVSKNRVCDRDPKMNNLVEKRTTSDSFRRLLSSVPKKLKRQTMYMRFKNAMMEDASSKGDREKLTNIARDAKAGWKVVRRVNISYNEENQHQIKNIDPHLIEMKRRAEREAKLDASVYESQVQNWSRRFEPVATLHIKVLTDAALADKSTRDDLKSAIAKLTEIEDLPRNPSEAYTTALTKAKELLHEKPSKLPSSPHETNERPSLVPPRTDPPANPSVPVEKKAQPDFPYRYDGIGALLYATRLYQV